MHVGPFGPAMLQRWMQSEKHLDADSVARALGSMVGDGEGSAWLALLPRSDKTYIMMAPKTAMMVTPPTTAAPTFGLASTDAATGSITGAGAGAGGSSRGGPISGRCSSVPQ